MLYHNKVSVLLEMPQKNLAEQFWTIVEDHCIENVILLVKENEKVAEFYPKLDDIFRMKNLEIYLDSAERTNKNIMLLAFNLQNKVIDVKKCCKYNCKLSSICIVREIILNSFLIVYRSFRRK